MLTHNTSRMVSLAALIMLIMVTTASGQSRTPCPPKDDKLYTPNKPQIEALLQKLEPFERDMRAVLSDLRTAQSEDTENHLAGRFAEFGNYYVEGSRAFCSAVNIANPQLARPCKAAQDVADGINNLIECGKGNATGCVGAVLHGAKVKAKKQRSKIKDELDELAISSRSPFPQDRIDLDKSFKQAANDLKLGGIEAASGVNKGAKGDVAGAFASTCKAGMTLKGAPVGEDLCSIGGNVAKVKENYELGRELDAAAKENEDRRDKLIQQLETKVSVVSQKIGQLRAEVYAIDWSAMGKPEPNMTPIKQTECDDSKKKEDELDRLAKEGLGQMERVQQVAPAREPAQAEPQADGLAVLGEVMGQAASLQRSLDAQKRLFKSQVPSSAVSPVAPQRNLCTRGYDCIEDIEEARRRDRESGRKQIEAMEARMREEAARRRGQAETNKQPRDKKGSLPNVPGVGGYGTCNCCGPTANC